jgi:hypothetical protein
MVRNTPLVMSSSLHFQSLVVFPGFRAAFSSASVSTLWRGSVDPSFAWPLGHHEYFFLKSSMLMLLFLASPSSGSQAVLVSIIWPTLTPTPSITASTQLKGKIASWKRVPQKPSAPICRTPCILLLLLPLGEQ